jgi:hypothetical protein
MPQLNPRTIPMATQYGDSIYELILSNWGNRGTLQDKNNGSIQFPGVITLVNGSIPIKGELTGIPVTSIFAIGVAPRSDWDRCILRTNAQQLIVANIAPSFINVGNVLETELVVAVPDPLIGQIPGPTIIRANQAGWYSDTYVPAGVAASVLPFGTALGNPPVGSTGGPIWYNPELRLMLYLASQAPLPPSSRAPFHHEYSYVFAATTEQLTKVVPVMGRRHVRVSVQVTGTGMVTPRLTGTFHETTLVSSPPVVVTEANYEVPLDAGVALDPTINSGIEFALEHPGVSYLMVKATATVSGAVMRVSIDAFD